ncbi:prolyl oligopeptidase family serine peptidase [Pontiellaceae bacterium B12219]|nr:prolyl oligopeptidase family serine peptidase [Pontiellaceae bacterium B12219]
MKSRLALMISVICLLLSSPGAEASDTWPGTLTDFNSYDRYTFETNGLNCIVTVPNVVAEGKPWVWRARFPGQVPDLDIALLSNGFHVAYVSVVGLFGSPEAVARFDAFYEFLTQTYGFDRRAALVGMSRGGLAVFNWARDNTDKVHCIYADAPVCDFKSWPGGFGTSDGNATQWAKCLTAYGFTEAEAFAYEGNPVDNMESLATAGIPLLHVVGDLDTTVPFSENTSVIETNYASLGGDMKVIHKPGVAHKHEIDNPTSTIVNFILNAVSADDHVPTLIFGTLASNGNFNVQFSGTTGQHYRVEYANELTASNSWLVTTDVVSLVESPLDVSVAPTNTVGFYRIGWLPWE